MQLRYFTLATLAAMSCHAWGLNVNTTPGQLESAIQADPASVTELTVSGSINAADLQFIADKMTSLRTLDLSNARIAAYQGDALINGAGTADADHLAPYSLAGVTATTVALPNTLATIGEGAMSGSAVTAVEIPSTVKSIGMGAFAGCRGIKTLTIPATVTSISPYAFKDMPELTTVDIKAPITAVPAAAFAGNAKLTKVTLPSTVTAIDSAAFNGCTSLAEIELPKAVTAIGASAFRGTALTDIDLQHLNKLSTIGDWAYADIATLNSAILPESVTSLGQGAFFGDKSLTEVTLPSSITEIADYAFTDATSMKVTRLNDHITTIGDLALKGWSSPEFFLPASLQYLGDYAMEDWTSVTKYMAYINVVPQLGTDVWRGVDQPNIKLYVPGEHKDEYMNSPQWQEFDVESITDVEEVIIADAAANKIKGYFVGADMIFESVSDMQLVEVYNTAGLKLMAIEPADTTATIDTDGWDTRLYIVRVILADGTPATLKLARR